MDGKEARDWIRGGMAANRVAKAEHKELRSLKKRVPMAIKWINNK
jgi:hypothetical protein